MLVRMRAYYSKHSKIFRPLILQESEAYIGGLVISCQRIAGVIILFRPINQT